MKSLTQPLLQQNYPDLQQIYITRSSELDLDFPFLASKMFLRLLGLNINMFEFNAYLTAFDTTVDLRVAPNRHLVKCIAKFPDEGFPKAANQWPENDLDVTLDPKVQDALNDLIDAKNVEILHELNPLLTMDVTHTIEDPNDVNIDVDCMTDVDNMTDVDRKTDVDCMMDDDNTTRDGLDRKPCEKLGLETFRQLPNRRKPCEKLGLETFRQLPNRMTSDSQESLAAPQLAPRPSGLPISVANSPSGQRLEHFDLTGTDHELGWQ